MRRLSLFALGMMVPLLVALITRHAWEDWWITFRASKNLAMGYGLVFEPGQILQTFTSPFSALVPAFLSWITGNHSDELVLWLYRVVGAMLLGGTVLNLDRLARLQGFARPALCFMLGFFLIDAKITDFSMNGQEAAYLVFFMSLTLVALVEQRTLLLGVAWAGLMWSRPDSPVYIAATGIGYVLATAWEDRAELGATFRRFFKAGLLTSALFGPWLAWTSWYYGSPISHTIVAKGLRHTPRTLGDGLLHFILYPVKAVLGYAPSALGGVFMPADYMFGGWPAWLEVFGRLLALLAAMAWLMPRVSALVRTASMGVFLGGFYLDYIAPFPAAWYYPTLTLLTIVTLSGLLQLGLERVGKRHVERRLLLGAATLAVVVWSAVSVCAVYEMRVQQAVIEDGGRRQIGLWLKQHATPGHRNTVFLECLGYIGYFSGLKMYDYPGMSSPEVVAARTQYGEHPAVLINVLAPDWVVMRPSEIELVLDASPDFANDYEQAAVFDQTDKLAAYRFLPGRGYLRYDRVFYVYHRRASHA
jgi:hypothetical protein